MEAFFGGTVILLYFISHYAAEPIFLAACFLPALYGAAVMLFLQFGASGRMIAARRKARKFLRRGVISGNLRPAFYQKCIKRTPPSFRANYTLFSEGKCSASELTLAATQSIKVRRSLLQGGSVGVGALACLSVFLTFYFIVPIGETLLRTAVCAFHAALGGVTLRILISVHVLVGERAAARFVELVDGGLLRVLEPRPSEPSFSSGAVKDTKPLDKAKEDPDVSALRAMLRELDRT